MKYVSRLTVLVCVLAAYTWDATFGDETSRIHVRKAALFKNGYGFIAGVVETAPGLDTVVISSPPEAMLGTFWLGAPSDGASVVSVRLEDDPDSGLRPVRDLAEAIIANPGREIVVTTDKGEFSGTLLPCDSPAIPKPEAGGRVEAAVEQSMPEICLLKTAEGLLVVRINEIRALRFAEEAMTSIATEARAKRLVCHFDRASQGGELPIHFFQKGVSWLPAYEIELLSDTQARVRMRGSILNDAIDLNETQVSFIAGHPNLRFSTVSEVITANISAGDFYQQLTAALSPSRFGVPAQSMMTQIATPWFVSNAPTISGIPISDPLTQASSVELNGEFSEDLFYYSPVPVSLQKGGRGAWLISDDLCPYEHVYTWEVPETTFSRDGGDSSGSDTVPESEPIWHAIRLNNAGRQPWSTGTTFVLRDGRPLSQDAMRYTAPGQETRVRVTKALGISAQKEERETAREEGFRRSRSYIMERVTVEGELRVRNTLEETVTLEISKEVLGEVQSTAPEANVSRRAEGIRHDNPHQTLVWTLELTPGEEETVSYTFQAYV